MSRRRLEEITRGTTTTGFLYDADGNRVARRDNGVTTVMIDNTFEWSSAGGLVSYYSHAGQVIAMRNTTGLHWIFGDHLGSASTVRTPAGTNLRQRYQPYGRLRGSATLPTEYGYTGQRLDPTGLMDYNARQYDPVLGRFTSPDTIIPDSGDPQSFNRYTYVNNNPVNMVDPSGHAASPAQFNAPDTESTPPETSLETAPADGAGFDGLVQFFTDPPYWDAIMTGANMLGKAANDLGAGVGGVLVACAFATGGFCAAATPVALPMFGMSNTAAGIADMFVAWDSCVVNNVSGWGCAGHAFLVTLPFFQSQAARASDGEGAAMWVNAWWNGVSGTADRIDQHRSAGQATTPQSSTSSPSRRGGGGGTAFSKM